MLPGFPNLGHYAIGSTGWGGIVTGGGGASIGMSSIGMKSIATSRPSGSTIGGASTVIVPLVFANLSQQGISS